jgi:outer membrane protein OmpA-like peptidoglycan-associated protein
MKIRLSLLCAVGSLLTGFAPSAYAANCKPPTWAPTPMPGYVIASCEAKAWAPLELQLADESKTVAGRRDVVTYQLEDESKNASADAARDFYVTQALKSGATLKSQPGGYQATLGQNVGGAQAWYVFAHGSGNEETTGSYSLTTLVETPFTQEVEARAMPAEGLQPPGKTCGPPPWVTKSLGDFKADDCDYRDFDSIKIDLPDGERTLAGRILTTHFVLSDPERDPVAILVTQNYRNALQTIGANIVSAPDDPWRVIATLQSDHGQYWFLYQHGDGNDSSTGSYELTTIQIGGPPPKSCTLEVYGVNFDFDKASLRADSAPVLEQVLALFASDPGYSAEIGGHTDNVGKPAYNLKLSDARAQAVKAWLVANGVAATRVSAHGYGDAKPLVANSSEENRAKNRRVELKRAHCQT